MTATQDRPNTSGAKYCDASGNSGIEKRLKLYPPIFNSTPARITEPAVGASTCASGNQVWTGHIGILTAKEAKKASHRYFCMPAGNSVCRRTVMSVVLANQYIAMIASSISSEPASV